jgi:predicted Zn-dependent protease
MTLLSSQSAQSAAEEISGSFNKASVSTYEAVFYQILESLVTGLASASQPPCHFRLTLAGEDSQFTRFNSSKVRQSGRVRDGQCQLTLIAKGRTATAKFPFLGDYVSDWGYVQQAVAQLMTDLQQLPPDPYCVLPTDGLSHEQNRSREVRSGQLLPAATVAETLMSTVDGLDFSGLYAGGLSYRAYGDSAGKRHWFETPSFTLDYSLFGQGCEEGDPSTSASQPPQSLQSRSGDQAVKGVLAGDRWHLSDYQQAIRASQSQLGLLARPVKAIPKGAYRTYLAPAAVADLMDMLIYGGLGEADLRQGNSAFAPLEKGDVQLSEKFSLSEDFQRLGVPRFNHHGEVAPPRLSIIHQGRWQNSLVNARSAKEYGKPSNAASAGETMRSPVVAPGQLSETQILSELDTGLYVSNLHYLNWSDLNAGRITGMTRYACFWVENGEIVAPIENLRFDDNFYRFLGEGLIALGDQQTFVPAVDTYDRRSLGGMWVPGMLIEQFRYTL